MAQQMRHLPGLENPAPRVDQWNAFTAEIELARKIGGIQHAASQNGKPVVGFLPARHALDVHPGAVSGDFSSPVVQISGYLRLFCQYQNRTVDGHRVCV